MAHEPSVRIDLDSSVPAVRQIADNLRILLVDGKLAPGTMLPSVRRVAIELGVHFNTVAEAYRELAGEGWLDLKHGRGALVVEREQPVSRNPAWNEDFRQRLRGMVAQLRAQGISADSIAAELHEIAKGVAQ